MDRIPIEVVRTLNLGTESVQNLQRAGEPLFAEGMPNLWVGSRANPWYGVDVLLDGIVTPGNQYRITVEGDGGASNLELVFPLDDDPWDYNVTTGNDFIVSMNFNGTPVEGQEQHRIRIRTSNNTRHDYQVNRIRIEWLDCTCEDDDPLPPFEPPPIRIARNISRIVCSGCGIEKTKVILMVICPETTAVLSFREFAAKNILEPCDCSEGWGFSDIPEFNAAASVVEG
jgi:hypothetical protein